MIISQVPIVHEHITQVGNTVQYFRDGSSGIVKILRWQKTVTNFQIILGGAPNHQMWHM